LPRKYLQEEEEEEKKVVWQIRFFGCRHVEDNIYQTLTYAVRYISDFFTFAMCHTTTPRTLYIPLFAI
jgi:hypothetical protein